MIQNESCLMGLAWSNVSGRRRRPEACQVSNKKDEQSTRAPGKRPRTILAEAVYARSKTKSLPNGHEAYDSAASESRGEPKEN